MFIVILLTLAQDWKQAEYPSTHWQTVVHPYTGILLSNKKEITDAFNRMNLKWIIYAKGKKEFRLKRLCIYHSIYITVWKMQNYKDSKGQWTPNTGIGKSVNYNDAWDNFGKWCHCSISWLFPSCMTACLSELRELYAIKSEYILHVNYTS